MNGTYFARPILSADNELRQKNVAIDPQASDCIAAMDKILDEANQNTREADRANEPGRKSLLLEGQERLSVATSRSFFERYATIICYIVCRYDKL
jgi:hypothetical protein